MSAAAGRRAEPAGLSSGRLTVLLTATFMTAFDFFVVNVATPSIQSDLHATSAVLELVVGAYAFSYAGALVLGGRLGDVFGHREMFGAGMIAFTATSALCGMAAGPGQLVAGRLAQGLAAALMMPQGLAIISRNCSAGQRARAMAWYGVAGGAGSVSAQLFGGLLVTADVAGLGWRLIFLINVPIGLAAALAALRVLPHGATSRAPMRRQLDILGALGLALAMGLLLVPITLGRTAGWPLWTWVSMCAAPVAFGFTMAWQRAYERRGGHPLLPLAVLRIRSFRNGVLASLAFMAFFSSYMFTLAFFLQDGLGLDAFHAGLVFAPAGIAFSLSATLGPRLVARFNLAALTGGGLLTTAGLVALGELARTGGMHASVPWATTIAAVISLGNGVVMPSLISAAMHDVPPARAGMAAGAFTTAQQFAGAAGIAIVGTLYFARAAAGPGGAMQWASGADALMMLAVVAVIVASSRPAKSTRTVSRVPGDPVGPAAPADDASLTRVGDR
jgi:MFS family permease